MSLLEKEKTRASKMFSRSSIMQTSNSLPGMIESIEVKMPPLPTLQDLATKHLPKDILKEKQLPLNERKVVLEKQAQIEEKERIEKEKKARFNERDFEFNGESNLDEILPPKFELWNQNNVTCKSTRGIMETMKMKGYANLPLDFRAFFKLKEEEPPNSKDKSIYLSFRKAKQKNPHLYKFTRKTKLREVHENIKSYYEMDCESVLTMSEIAKRGEIMAKLYMKLNLEEALEKMKKEEEAALKSQEPKEGDEPKALTEIPEDTNGLKIINEDDEDSEDPGEDKENELIKILPPNAINIEGATAKEINEKIRELLNNKSISLNGILQEDLQKIMLINESFEEIVEYFESRIMENFERENYEECVYLKGKKEELVQSLKNYTDYESLLRTLIIYKLNNNI